MTATPAAPQRGRTRAESAHRHVIQLVLGLFVLATVVCGMLVVNAALGDSAINRDRGAAVAEVVNEGGDRSTVLVRYRDDAGEYHSPVRGLKYPTGLERGDRVQVEYQRSDTDNVKVAGRSWTLSILPALSTWAVCGVVTVVLLVLIRWRWNRWVPKAGVDTGP
ncbi:MAG: DUF3592 domain-containing protein [Mycobacteriaceae bacterium]|uniref:DUF3592 domain-containing protein n=1 Tax=Corynebacterium sp. TaxID=1720 RepID=UPI003F95B21A